MKFQRGAREEVCTERETYTAARNLFMSIFLSAECEGNNIQRWTPLIMRHFSVSISLRAVEKVNDGSSDDCEQLAHCHDND
jgi:hypothetical protein